MGFADRLANIRHRRGLTQNELADHVGVHVSQIRRYEAGTTTPALDVLRNLAIALNTTTDQLVFDHDERGRDPDLTLAFEATRQLDDDERRTIRDVIEALLLKHDAKRWNNAS
ncbi:MAG: helix-turn-helix domain-containing protein [Actinobacteria bacterium]|nr:helix-turn-helix domain-containing protein [Actinomycetota bacterium]